MCFFYFYFFFNLYYHLYACIIILVSSMAESNIILVFDILSEQCISEQKGSI